MLHMHHTRSLVPRGQFCQIELGTSPDHLLGFVVFQLVCGLGGVWSKCPSVLVMIAFELHLIQGESRIIESTCVHYLLQGMLIFYHKGCCQGHNRIPRCCWGQPAVLRAMSQFLIHPLIVMSLDCSVGCWRVLFCEVSLLQHVYGLNDGNFLDLVGDQFQFCQMKVWVHIC
jgi:hypothetical protein